MINFLALGWLPALRKISTPLPVYLPSLPFWPPYMPPPTALGKGYMEFEGLAQPAATWQKARPGTSHQQWVEEKGEGQLERTGQVECRTAKRAKMGAEEETVPQSRGDNQGLGLAGTDLGVA